jgi:hypothetical protein
MPNPSPPAETQSHRLHLISDPKLKRLGSALVCKAEMGCDVVGLTNPRKR